MSTSLPAPQQRPGRSDAALSRPVVLVSVPDGDPKRAELWDDNASDTTVQVVYCDSRRSAYVARKRIVGPAPMEQLAPAAEPAEQALTAAVARPTRCSLREAGDPQGGIYFGRDRRPKERGRRVRLERGSNFVKVIDAATDEVIDHFGHSGKFWLAPPDLAGTTGPDHAKQAQITAWIDRHGLTPGEATVVDAARIVREYHAAMAVDHAEAQTANERRGNAITEFARLHPEPTPDR